MLPDSYRLDCHFIYVSHNKNIFITILLVQVELYYLYRSTTHPKFDQTGVLTNDLHIIEFTFRILEMLTLTTEPPGNLQPINPPHIRKFGDPYSTHII